MSPAHASARWSWTIVAAAALVAAISARDYAGGWNDGSRLATVESLVDRRTWAIDDSFFVKVPSDRPPYRADDPALSDGTKDKLFIDGHYYSDKSPVPALLMAGEYAVVQAASGLTARARPDLFCLVMTLGTSGLAYVVAVWSIFRLGRALSLPIVMQFGLTASFALATVALPYVRHVNNHILLLGITAALLAEIAIIAQAGSTPLRLLGIGTLAGFGLTIDLGAGPVVMLGAGCQVLFRCGLWRAALVAAAATPWVALHLALNYMIGGTWQPANAVAAHFDWPGNPFPAATLTGGWNHASFGSFLLYAVDLLVGKRGFLGHNLALYLAVPAGWWLLRRRRRETPELTLCVLWGVGIWLVYAATSTNYSGACCSVRWFVPLLAPGYFVLAVFLRDRPGFQRDFAVLSLWGAAMAVVMWWKGPWMQRMVPQYWVFIGGAAISWAIVRIRAVRSSAKSQSRAAATCHARAA